MRVRRGWSRLRNVLGLYSTFHPQEPQSALQPVNHRQSLMLLMEAVYADEGQHVTPLADAHIQRERKNGSG